MYLEPEVPGALGVVSEEHAPLLIQVVGALDIALRGQLVPAHRYIESSSATRYIILNFAFYEFINKE